MGFTTHDKVYKISLILIKSSVGAAFEVNCYVAAALYDSSANLLGLKENT